MNALFAVLGVMGSNLDHREVWTTKIMSAQKKWNSEKISWYIRNFWRSLKTVFVPYLPTHHKSESLEWNECPVRSSRSYGLKLDQSRGMNPENNVSTKKWNSEKIPWYIRSFCRSVKTFFVPYLPTHHKSESLEWIECPVRSSRSYGLKLGPIARYEPRKWCEHKKMEFEVNSVIYSQLLAIHKDVFDADDKQRLTNRSR